MSHDCHEGSCSSHDHHQHGQGSCSHSSCGCCHTHEESSSKCNFAEQLIEMADEAWMEVLREKIKENIIQHSGKQLDELAKLVSESNNTRWKNKMAAHRSCSDFKEKVDAFFKQ